MNNKDLTITATYKIGIVLVLAFLALMGIEWDEHWLSIVSVVLIAIAVLSPLSSDN